MKVLLTWITCSEYSCSPSHTYTNTHTHMYTWNKCITCGASSARRV